MKSFPLDQFKAVAAARPPGYLSDMLAHGTIRDGQIHFEDEVFAALTRRHRPTLLQMAQNLRLSMINWIVAGAPVVTQAEYNSRAAICAACPHYSTDGFLHRCALCGCTDVKPWLATENCADTPPRWPALFSRRLPAAAPPQDGGGAPAPAPPTT